MSDTIVLSESPIASFLSGDVIAGKYRLDHELGRGAMGTVWAATHTTLGQRVAIKLIAAEHAHSAEARQRFRLEAKAAARLKSRHAVQVYDDGETLGVPYIVMEYLDGETLEARLDRQRDMALPEAIRITSHVGRALAKAHARGIVHRDLKSGNVFIARTEDDELGWVAKVLDFGVAKLVDMASASTTKTGTIVGTPLFMSPEQIRGASTVDHRADLYSLGMVFYNMVTGTHPFNGPSYSDVLVAICTEDLPDIRERAPWIPEAVAAWYRKACARDLGERFQSADEMIEALREAAGPHSRLSRPSVPEAVGGPSGTLLGHVPPHVMATIRAEAPEVSTHTPELPNEHTLRSRTGPFRARESEGEKTPRVSSAESKRKWTYSAIASLGAAAAVTLVIGVLLVRYVFLQWSESSRSGDSGSMAVTSAPPESTPFLDTSRPPEPQRVAPATPAAPPIESSVASQATPDESGVAHPRRAPAQGARSPQARTRSETKPAPSAGAGTPSPKPASRAPEPDMGF
jgi:serine/threonine-protein kinase